MLSMLCFMMRCYADLWREGVSFHSLRRWLAPHVPFGGHWVSMRVNYHNRSCGHGLLCSCNALSIQRAPEMSSTLNCISTYIMHTDFCKLQTVLNPIDVKYWIKMTWWLSCAFSIPMIENNSGHSVHHVLYCKNGLLSPGVVHEPLGRVGRGIMVLFPGPLRPESPTPGLW